MVEVKNKVCLIVHDGWGIATEPGLEGNAIEAGSTTNMDTVAKDHSHRKIAAHGTAVGLSEGLMGNSEVGHLNIGAGRIVWQDIVRIDVSIKKKEFHKNKVILESTERAKKGNGRLQLLGLISDGGIHSHINHLSALLETVSLTPMSTSLVMDVTLLLFPLEAQAQALSLASERLMETSHIQCN